MIQSERMNISFFRRFLVFTLSFWVGTILSVSALTFFHVVSEVVFIFHSHFGGWLLDGLRYYVFPIALAEMFRSPLMGILFAWLGSSHWNQAAIIRFGIVCGAASYVVAWLLNLLGHMSWSMAPYFQQPLAMYMMLGLPVALILLSRFNAAWNLSINSPETDPSTHSE